MILLTFDAHCDCDSFNVTAQVVTMHVSCSYVLPTVFLIWINLLHGLVSNANMILNTLREHFTLYKKRTTVFLHMKYLESYPKTLL
jgi:hypothetical protein